jgi:hypothetical protein
MSRFIGALIFSIVLVSCSKEDIICEQTTLELCNPTINKIVLYNLTGDTHYDTLFPGECSVSIHGSLKSNDTRKVNFTTPTESIGIQLNSCNRKIPAPGSYFDLNHCENKYFNPEEGELNTDCGGDCKPCQEVRLSCESNFNNSLKWSNQTTTLSQTGTFFGDKIDNKEIIMFRFNNGDELMLALPSFHSEVPTKSERMLIGLESYHAEAWFVSQLGDVYLAAIAGQSIYFEVNGGGEKFIKFCEAKFSYDNGIIINGSARLEVKR